MQNLSKKPEQGKDKRKKKEEEEQTYRVFGSRFVGIEIYKRRLNDARSLKSAAAPI